MGGLLAAKQMCDSGEQRFCIRLRGLIDFTPSSPFSIRVTEIPSQAVLLQKHMSVAVSAKSTSCDVILQHPSITAEEKVCNVPRVAIADWASSVNQEDTQKKDDDQLQQSWQEGVKIPEQFISHHEQYLTVMFDIREI